MKPAGWDVDVAKAYNEIPDEYKNHMYVAKNPLFLTAMA